MMCSSNPSVGGSLNHIGYLVQQNLWTSGSMRDKVFKIIQLERDGEKTVSVDLGPPHAPVCVCIAPPHEHTQEKEMCAWAAALDQE